jgi:hypothetical protein
VSNAIFPHAREAFAKAQVDWEGDDIEVVFIDLNAVTGEQIDINTAVFLSDIDAAAQVATVALAGMTADLGVLDANDATAPQVEGNTVEALVICTSTGDPSTSRLLIYVDDAQGLPVIPNSGDIRIQWPEDGIATL